MSECGFCHGKPVGDAATWLDGKPRPSAPCPRCGVTTPFESGPAVAVPAAATAPRDALADVSATGPETPGGGQGTSGTPSAAAPGPHRPRMVGVDLWWQP